MLVFFAGTFYKYLFNLCFINNVNRKGITLKKTFVSARKHLTLTSGSSFVTNLENEVEGKGNNLPEVATLGIL